MYRLKKIIKGIPFVAQIAKISYDWHREKKLDSEVIKVSRQASAPFSNGVPPYYVIGHEPTIRCNLRCKMCYQGGTRALRQEELGTEEVLGIYEKLKEKATEIKIVGGEPFVHQGIFELIDFWDKQNIRIILQTNCTLLDEEKIKKLKEFINISDIATSLDGPAEIHDMVRGVPGAFLRLKKAVELIKKEMPGVPITVFATLLIWDNLDNFERLIDTCKELGLGTINVLFEQVYSPTEEKQARLIFNKAFGWKEEEYRLNTQLREPAFSENLTAEKLKTRLSEIRRYGLKKSCFVNFVPFNYYKNIDKYLGKKPTRAFCLKLLSPELRINQNGDVIWCDVIEKSFGNLCQKSPDEIWLSSEYQKFRQYLFKSTLPICYRCCKAHYIS